MPRPELLETLRGLELRLRSAPVQAFFAGCDAPTRARFVECREQISAQLGRLTTAEFAEISAELESLERDLRTGAARLAKQTTALKSAEAILETLGTVLGLTARIASLAV